MKYFVRRGNSIRGPYSVDQIRKQLKSDSLKYNDRLSDSRQGPWAPISTVISTESNDQIDEDEDMSEFSHDTSIDYLSDAEDYPLPPARRRTKGKQQLKTKAVEGSRYPALRRFQMFHRVSGWITMVSCLIGSLIFGGLLIAGLVNKDPGIAMSSGIGLVYFLSAGLIGTTYVWAIADGIQVVIDIESGIRNRKT